MVLILYLYWIPRTLSHQIIYKYQTVLFNKPVVCNSQLYRNTTHCQLALVGLELRHIYLFKYMLHLTGTSMDGVGSGYLSDPRIH